MAKVCVFCGKKPFYGNKVSHSNRKSRIRWMPNLKRVKAVLKGTTQTILTCTRCIRSGLVIRPVKNQAPVTAARATS